MIKPIDWTNVVGLFAIDVERKMKQKLDCSILECIKKNNLTIEDVDLIQPSNPFEGKYYLLPKKYSPEVGERADLSKAYFITEMTLKELIYG